MSSIKRPYRLIISGGGTGGHVYPAIAIANSFTERFQDAKVLFVGAQGKWRCKKCPRPGINRRTLDQRSSKKIDT